MLFIIGGSDVTRKNGFNLLQTQDSRFKLPAIDALFAVVRFRNASQLVG
jgi:hypothetical protein